VLCDSAQQAPLWKAVVSIPFAVTLAVLGFWLLLRPDPRSAEERALAAIKKRGGVVTVDEKSPNRTIVKVSFSEAYWTTWSRRRLSQTDLASLKPHFEALPQLRELDLCNADIMDRDLLELRGLTQLKTLIVGSVIPMCPVNLTEEGVNKLRKALPNTEVHFHNPFPPRIDPGVLKLLKDQRGQ
jgi:hypothetical protein